MIAKQLTSRAIVALTIRIVVALLATSLVFEFGYLLHGADDWFPAGRYGMAFGFVFAVALATLMMLFADVIAGWVVPAQTLTFSGVDRSRVFSFALRLLGFWLIADGIPHLVQPITLRFESDILISQIITGYSLPGEIFIARLAMLLVGFLMLFKAPWLTGWLERWQEKIGAGKDEPPLTGAANSQLLPLWETPLFALAIRLLGIWFLLASLPTLTVAGATALRYLSQSDPAQVYLWAPPLPWGKIREEGAVERWSFLTQPLSRVEYGQGGERLPAPMLPISPEQDAWMVTGAIVRALLAVGMFFGSRWIAAWLFGKTVLFTDGRQSLTMLMDGGMVDEYFCDECGQSVPEKAAACPYCGDDFEKGKTNGSGGTK